MHTHRSLRYKRWQAIILIVGLLMAMPRAFYAQESAGKILGTVTDQQGSVIAGAKVTVTNTDTHVSNDTLTDKDGNFQILSLPIGNYQVAVEHQGFKRAISDIYKLQINQSLRIDPKLEVGSVTETVEVSAGAAVVETVSATLGQSITSRPLVNLPLNGRNVLQLALLQPGVSENNPGDGGAGGFNIAGGRADSVTFLLDGGVNNNLLNNGVVYNPNPDTVAEFRILTSNYTAEYGRNAGGIISVVTKSGTNSFHGSVFEFLRNDAFNANSFFNNLNGIPKEVLKRNQFGFTVGGPITIPKVVNGKDRFFFFAGYQGQRQVKTDTSGPVTVFTPAELNGDFSLSNVTRTGPDPNVVSFLSENPFFQPNPALAARGIIDPSRINPVAQNYIKAGLLPTSATGELVSQGSSKNDADELTLKFDIVPTENDRFAVTLGGARNPQLTAFVGSNVGGFPNLSTANRYFANIAYTKTFSPTLLNEFRFTTQRRNQLQAKPGLDLPTASDLGVGTTPDNPTGPPKLGFASGMVIGFSTQGPTTLIDNTFIYSDTVSWVRGKHNWKFGATFAPYQNNTVFDFFVNGEFFFDGPPDLGGIGSSNDFADFLFGLPDEYLQFGEAPSDIRSKSTYAFVQDEWHVRRNLVLTLGLRYEYSQPKRDTRGRAFSLALGQQSTVFKNAPLGLLFPGDQAAPKGANFADKNDWAPRFGFAWDPRGDGKTSIRGGVGVFYDILKGEDNLQFNGQAPFFGFADLFFDPLSGNPSGPVDYFSDPFGATGIPNSFPSRPPSPDIDFAASGFTPFGGGGVFFVDPHLRTPYTYQYNLSIQRQIVKNMIVEASYVGSSSHKLTALVDANPFILGTTHRIFNTQPGNDDFSFSYLLEFRNVANANYNSLQLSLQKQLSNTFMGTTYFTLAYTLAHSIDTASGFRNRNSGVPSYDTKLFRADSDFDVRQRLTFSGGWDLPFDRLWSSGPSRLLGGWSLYPIVTWRTGFPLDVFAGFSASRTAVGPSGAGDRQNVHANIVGSQITTFDPKNPQIFRGRTGNYFFNPANFTSTGFPTTAEVLANPGVRTYGTLPRNAFRGPGRTNFDLALAKTTPLIGDKLRMEFRAEAFNVLNHTQFANPNTTITSGQFGQITTTSDPRIMQFAVRFTF
ncbi:MAG TPA: TonB-dependent receptor [Blastocatellia bacterium]|nr:TonB-dependent receptor [Blastocatellia bacterium]